MRKIEGQIPEYISKKITGRNTVASSDGYFVVSFGDLVKSVAEISYLNKDHLIFFRGQNSDYLNKGGSSTFYPTIYRGDYVGRAELSDRFATLLAASRKLVDRFKSENITGHDELTRKKLIQWSILQHYEICDTPLIDFTHSLRVAASFAQLEAKGKYAYVYAFGLPYLTNRISNNSEHDLVNIRLLSICPPEALRPYYQEGYLAATEDIETEYDDKTELDFNNRLIAKFKIPSGKNFWGRNFNAIPKSALYPKKDKIAVLSSSIIDSLSEVTSDSDIRQFLTVWAELERYVTELAGEDGTKQSFLRSLNQIKSKSIVHPRVLKDIDSLRRFRNTMVHSPHSVKDDEVSVYFRLLLDAKNRLYRKDA